MSQKNPQRHPIASALKEAGFIRLPNLWIRPQDMPDIHAIAGRYRHEVNTIKHETRATLKQNPQGNNQLQDPRTDRDAAWEALEARQSASRG